MADLPYEELLELERPNIAPVKVIPATTIADVEKYLKDLPRNNATRKFAVELVEGYQLSFSEAELSALIQSNRKYKNMLAAAGVDKPVEKLPDSAQKINSKILTSSSFEEATKSAPTGYQNGSFYFSIKNSILPPLMILVF